jgi:hypothetical protein
MRSREALQPVKMVANTEAVSSSGQHREPKCASLQDQRISMVKSEATIFMASDIFFQRLTTMLGCWPYFQKSFICLQNVTLHFRGNSGCSTVQMHLAMDEVF